MLLTKPGQLLTKPGHKHLSAYDGCKGPCMKGALFGLNGIIDQWH